MERTTALDEPRRFDRERTRQQILEAAREEFAAHGLAGARVEAIAAKTHTAKRMIYYYFGSKEGLYLAVLEQVYAAIRHAEQELDLLGLSPQDAIRRLVAFTFDYHDAHPEFSRLVAIENIHGGEHVERSESIRSLNSAVVEMLDTVLRDGRQEGLFRPDIDGLDVHMLITSFCFFRVSNRHTFSLLFGRDLGDPALREHHKMLITDAVLCAVRPRPVRPTQAGSGAASAAARRRAR